MDWIEVRRAKRKDEKEKEKKKYIEQGRKEVLDQLKAKGVDLNKIESKPQK